MFLVFFRSLRRSLRRSLWSAWFRFLYRDDPSMVQLSLCARHIHLWHSSIIGERNTLYLMLTSPTYYDYCVSCSARRMPEED